MCIKYIWGWKGLNQKKWEEELIYQIISRHKTKELKVLVVMPFLPRYLRGLLRVFSTNTQLTIIESIIWILSLRYKIIFLSYENLDSTEFSLFGKVCQRTENLVLSHWPDWCCKNGQRLPYWYNLIDWPDYPNLNSDTIRRFGRKIQISELIKPKLIETWSQRIDEVVLVASHLNFPRNKIVQKLKKEIDIEIYGKAGKTFCGSKEQILKKYRFAMYDENSLGLGYETEKLPEILASSCVPVYLELSPLSDFEEHLCEHEGQCVRTLRLKRVPSLSVIEKAIGMLR